MVAGGWWWNGFSIESIEYTCSVVFSVRDYVSKIEISLISPFRPPPPKHYRRYIFDYRITLLRSVVSGDPLYIIRSIDIRDRQKRPNVPLYDDSSVVVRNAMFVVHSYPIPGMVTAKTWPTVAREFRGIRRRCSTFRETRPPIPARIYRRPGEVSGILSLGSEKPDTTVLPNVSGPRVTGPKRQEFSNTAALIDRTDTVPPMLVSTTFSAPTSLPPVPIGERPRPELIPRNFARGNNIRRGRRARV